MRVTLINYTQNAAEMLILSKHTRLTLRPELLQEIKELPVGEKLKELEYIANTIPSSWEFVDYTFLIEGVSRAFTHQFVRTRTGSYAQQTMRMNDITKDYHYVLDCQIEDDPDPDRQVSAYRVIKDTNEAIIKGYNDLTRLGYPSEVARGLLPTNIATNIMAKFNLRSLSQLLASRLGGRTQDEYRAVAEAMYKDVIEVHPWAELFLQPKGVNYYKSIEQFAAKLPREQKWELLKIVDKMRKDDVK